MTAWAWGKREGRKCDVWVSAYTVFVSSMSPLFWITALGRSCEVVHACLERGPCDKCIVRVSRRIEKGQARSRPNRPLE